MDFMTCNTCRATVEINATGVCRGCQLGIRGVPQEDSWEFIQERKRRESLDEEKALKEKIQAAEEKLDEMPKPVVRTVNKTKKPKGNK